MKNIWVLWFIMQNSAVNPQRKNPNKPKSILEFLVYLNHNFSNLLTDSKNRANFWNFWGYKRQKRIKTHEAMVKWKLKFLKLFIPHHPKKNWKVKNFWRFCIFKVQFFCHFCFFFLKQIFPPLKCSRVLRKDFLGH